MNYNNSQKQLSFVPLTVIVKILKNIKILKEKLKLRELSKFFNDAVYLSCKIVNLDSSNVNDIGLSYFNGIKNINLSNCKQITDIGLQHLQGVHTINLWNCKQITDVGLQYLRKVQIIDISGCYFITDIGLQHLEGAHEICLSVTDNITDIGLKHLLKVPELYMFRAII